MTIKNVLVTGGAGFIGSKLVNRLIGEGHNVYVVDDLSTGKIINLNSAAHFYKLDIADYQSWDILKNSIQKCDVIFHLAAQSSGEISYENPARDLDINTRGTLLSLDWSKKMGVKRYVYASTMATYGDVYLDVPVEENFSLIPKSFYGISKMCSENLLRLYREQFGLSTVALRLFNVYGTGQNMDNMKQGMVSIYLKYLVSDKPIIVKGDLKRFRDFVHVDDVVEAFIKAWQMEENLNWVFNISSGKKTTVKELLEIMLSADNKKNNEYPIEFQPGTPGDIFGICANIDRAKKILKWAPKKELSKGLKEMLEWARHV